MKYKILTALTIILGVFIFRLSVVKDSINNYEFVYEQVEQISHDLYFYDGNTLVNVNVSFDNNVTIEEVFNLLTNQSNSLNHYFDTKLITSTSLYDYTIDDNCLTINLSEDFLRYDEEECYKIYAQLKNSFSNLGYEFLKIQIEGEELINIGYINISNGIVLYNI